MPSGVQNPSLIHVVPPMSTNTTAATPTAKSAFEISPARQSPKAADMISIARANELMTKPAHVKSLRPDVSTWFPEAVIEYASAAPIAVNSRNNVPTAALDAVAAAPQPSCPASVKVVLIAAANHIRLSTANPEKKAATRIRVLL